MKEVKALMEGERSVHLVRSRTQNYASHGMATLGRGEQHMACWLGNVPLEVRESIPKRL